MRSFALSLFTLALAASSASAFSPLTRGLGAHSAHPALSAKLRPGAALAPRSNEAVVREVSVLPFAPAAESYANIWVSTRKHVVLHVYL